MEYAGADYIHIDYLEGEKAPIKISSLTPIISKIPYDVHIISKQLSGATVQALNNTSTAYFCVQYENLIDKSDIKNIILFNGLCGIAFTMDTDISIIEECIKVVDFILIMCSKPGVSGAKFNEENIERIRFLRKKYPALPIHEDGGIDNKRIQIMEHLGVNLCVSGSYLASTDGMELIRRVCELKFRNPDVCVSDIMTLKKNFNSIQEDKSFYDLLCNIDQSHMGAAFVENEFKEFVGIITDGDIRRTIIKFREKTFSLKVRDLVNKNAYCVDRGKKLAEVFFERMMLQKGVMVIPIVENGFLVGVIDLDKYF